MSKTKKTSNKPTITCNEDQIKNRRKALKSMLAASGVVAGSQALSSEWARPLVESVVLPAHAQTSEFTGTFDSEMVGAGLLLNQPWYAKSNLLDTLISPADAGINSDYAVGVRNSVCSINTGVPGTVGGIYQFMFKIVGSNVDVCASSLGNNTVSGAQPQRCVQQNSTTISGQDIADVEFLMDSSIDEVGEQELIQLSNLSLNSAQNQISGTLNLAGGPSNNTVRQQCRGDFTCDLTAAVYDCSAAGTCQGNGSIPD